MTEANFRQVRKGYEPADVHAALSKLNGEVDRLTGELGRAQDEAAGLSVENTKAEQHIADLAGRIAMLEDELATARAAKDRGVPPTFENLGARIGQILGLAQEEADELRSSAQSEADELLANAKQQAADAVSAAESTAAEARSRAELDAARTLEDAKQRADAVREEADAAAIARLEEAEAVYEAQRAQAAQASADFEKTLAERRTEAMQELDAALAQKNQQVELAEAQLNTARAEAERLATDSRDEADRVLRQAQTQANSMLSEAKTRAEGIRQNSERELAAATARRDSITAQLANVRQMLATLGGSPVHADPFNPRSAADWAAGADPAPSAGSPDDEEVQVVAADFKAEESAVADEPIEPGADDEDAIVEELTDELEADEEAAVKA